MSKARNIADLGSNDVLDTDGTGATVSGHLTVSDSTPDFVIQDTDGTNQLMKMQQVGGASMIKFRSDTNDGELYFTGEVTGNNKMKIATNGDITMYKDDGSSTGIFFDASSGSVGVGVVPENWSSTWDSFSIGTSGSLSAIRTSNLARTFVSSNCYNDGSSQLTTWKYTNTEAASQHAQVNGSHIFRVASSGTADATITWGDGATIDTSGVILNEGGADRDFRVESNNNTNMLFVDAGLDRVGIGYSNPEATLNVNNTIRLGKTSESYYADVTANTLSFNRAGTSYIDALNDSGSIQFRLKSTYENALRLNTSETAFNDDSVDRDFRVEGENQSHLLFVDAGNDRIGVNETSPLSDLHIKHQTDIGTGQNSGLGLESGTGSQMYLLQCGRSGQSNAWFNLRDRSNSRDIFSVTDTDGTFYLWNDGNFRGNNTFNDDGSDNDFRVESDNESSMLFVDGGNDRVGIKTGSPRTVFDLNSTRELKMRWGTAGSLGELQNIAGDYISNNVYPSSESAGTITYTKTVGDKGNVILQDYTDGIRFYTGVTGTAGSTGTLNNFERVKIDTSGNFLVGKTSTGSSIRGSELRDGTSGYVATFKSDADGICVDRSGNGANIEFRRSGSSLGEIGFNNTARLYIVAGDTGLDFEPSTDAIRPVSGSGGARDNVIDLGRPDVRFDDFYATSGTVNTSDENEKQQIANLTDAEIAAAKAISKLFKTFKWNDAVAKKGDAARIHSGVVAQQVQNAMTAVGLDAADYGFWCSNTWWETHTEVAAIEANAETGVEAKDAYTHIESYYTAEEAPEGAVERTRLGIRYPELLAFIGAATEQRLANIETRLAALEA